MLIYKNSELHSGYCGVFICKGKKGNEILKKLENATHTEWKKGNWNENPIEGKNILDKIAKFKNKSIDDYYGANIETEFSIQEFDNLISLFSENTTTKTTAPIKKTEHIKSEVIHKNILNLSSFVIGLKNDLPIYQLDIEVSENINNLKLEILVATDSDKMKLRILECDEQKFEQNILILDLKKGVNKIEYILDDFLKHSIYYKKI